MGPPPHDTDAERVLLGGMLQHPGYVIPAVWRCGVRATDLYWHCNRVAFGALVELYDLWDADHNRPGQRAILRWIELHADLGDFGGRRRFVQWAADLWDLDPCGVRCWWAAAVVNEMSLRRHVIHRANEMIRDAYAGEVSEGELVTV